MLITIVDVLSLIPISRSSLYTRMQEPDFPKPIKIGGRVFWKAEEIHAYIDSKQSEA
jgi:predicted DNA-binding transcriptional regulator AlpA